jgi:multiple sugar transport system substrate-binding protein
MLILWKRLLYFQLHVKENYFMSTTYNRRQAIALGLGSLAGLSAFGLAACGGSSTPASSQHTTLQMIFWGSTTRDKVTRKSIELFQKSHQNITITSQYTGFDTYWTKLNTLVAGGSLPDLVQMDMRYLAQYVKKELLLDLTQLISKKTIDLSDFDTQLLQGSKANNVVYGIPLGGNYQGYLYDKGLLEKGGLKTLPENMTWDEFATHATQLSKALGNGVYGSADNSGDITNFEIWIRQHNKELYTNEGGLGFTETDAADWFNYWSKLRQAGGCPPMNIQAGLDVSGTPTDSSVVKGKAVFSILYSNQYEAWQKATTRPLGLTMIPTGASPGMYLKASMLLSISAKSKYQNEAASYINFIVNDNEGVKALGIERGVPGSTKARTILTDLFTPAQKEMMAYMNVVSKSQNTRPKEVLDPPGAGQIADILRRVSQAVGFGKLSVQEGAKNFFADAKKAITPA